jgi:hypothetical protein
MIAYNSEADGVLFLAPYIHLFCATVIKVQLSQVQMDHHHQVIVWTQG